MKESKPREWWIEDIEANRDVPAEVAKHRYVPVIERSAYDQLRQAADDMARALGVISEFTDNSGDNSVEACLAQEVLDRYRKLFPKGDE